MDGVRPYWVCRRFRSAISNKLFNEVHMATYSWGKAMDNGRALHEKLLAQQHPTPYVVVTDHNGNMVAKWGKAPRKVKVPSAKA